MLKPIPCPRCGMMPEIDTGFSDAPYPPGQEYVSCPGVRVGIPGVVDQSCGTHAIGVAAWNYRAIPAADARAEALREAADVVEDYCSDMPDLAGHGHSVGLKDAILALIPETKPQAADQHKGGE